mmetsp:Transcript_15140/g.45669  ORF Transcript_15140/g.45669 Transcript_15140/m.45669 type:complete len:258 (-) Transcript_15140:1808-2581(-)
MAARSANRRAYVAAPSGRMLLLRYRLARASRTRTNAASCTFSSASARNTAEARAGRRWLNPSSRSARPAVPSGDTSKLRPATSAWYAVSHRASSSSLAMRWVSAAARGVSCPAGEASSMHATVRGTANAASVLAHSRSPPSSITSAGGSGNADGVSCTCEPFASATALTAGFLPVPEGDPEPFMGAVAPSAVPETSSKSEGRNSLRAGSFISASGVAPAHSSSSSAGRGAAVYGMSNQGSVPSSASPISLICLDTAS